MTDIKRQSKGRKRGETVVVDFVFPVCTLEWVGIDAYAPTWCKMLRGYAKDGFITFYFDRK